MQSEQCWAILIPLSKGVATYHMVKQQILVGRNKDCDIQIQDKRLSGKHCIIGRKENGLFVLDMSTNGTFIYNAKIGKDKTQIIQDQTEIWLLPNNIVHPEESLGFKFSLSIKKNQMSEEQKEEQERQIQYYKENIKKSNQFLQSFKQQIMCPYCMQVLSIPIVLQPCNHRLCGGCLSDLISNKKGNCIQCRAQISTASRDTTFMAMIDDYLTTHPEEKRNDQIEINKHNIFGHGVINVKAMLIAEKQPRTINKDYKGNKKKHQENNVHQLNVPVDQNKTEKRRRSPRRKIDISKDLALENIPSKTKIQTTKQTQNIAVEERQIEEPKREIIEQLTTKQTTSNGDRGKGRRRGGGGRRGKGKAVKQISSDISAYTDNEEDPLNATCKQCKTPREKDGFKCPIDQVHGFCFNCHKVIPIREDPVKYDLCCALCKNYYCNLYMPNCQKHGPKLIKIRNRKETAIIDPAVFRNNRVEHDAFKSMMVSNRQKQSEVFDRMVKHIGSGRFMYVEDKKIMRVPPPQSKEIKLEADSPICDNCWRELWFQMVFAFRSEESDNMPETIKERPPCYWGVNCRTMEHSTEHAKKFNHMAFQTRF